MDAGVPSTAWSQPLRDIHRLIQEQNVRLHAEPVPPPDTWAICPTHETDDRLFEELCFHLFAAGFSREVVREKWPAFRQVFEHFSIPALAAWDADQCHLARQNPGIVRNRRKIAAVISNAQLVARLCQQWGSWQAWLNRYPEPELFLLHRDLVRDFSHIGASAAEWFLLSSGFPFYLVTPHARRLLSRLGLLPGGSYAAANFNEVIQAVQQATGVSTWSISIDWFRFASGFRMREAICAEDAPRCVKCPLWDHCAFFNQEQAPHAGA